MKTIGYIIKISVNDYENYTSRINYNESLNPELLGFLLGKAEPIILKDKEEENK